MKYGSWCLGRGFSLGLVLVAALLAGPALAGQHELTLGVTRADYLSSMRSSTGGFQLYELAYHRPLASEGFLENVVVGGGLRAGPRPFAFSWNSAVPFEGFARLQFRARLGFWEVQAGPELGVSGMARLIEFPAPLPTWGPNELESARLSPMYLAMSVSPAQFRYKWLLVSALEVNVGTSSWPVQSILRYQVGLLRVGVNL